MAVRWTSSGQSYSRSIGLGSVTQWSASCWVKITTDRNAFSTVLALDNGTTDAWALQTGSDGTTLTLGDEASLRGSGVALTASTWYWVGVTINGANGSLIVRAANTGTSTVDSFTNGSTTTNMATLRIGDSPWGIIDTPSEWFNGNIAALKIWTGVALTQAALEQEAYSYLPQRTTNLLAWYPFTRAETVDYSGNGSTLSGGTGATTEDGPPLAWGSRQRTIVIPATTAVTGTLAGSLPALAADVSGEATASGTAAVTLPAATASLSGELAAAGSLAASLPPPTASVAGEITATGSLGAALPPITATLGGQLPTGSLLDAAFPALTGDLSGDVVTPVVFGVTLPQPGAVFTGTVEVPVFRAIRADVTGMAATARTPTGPALDGPYISDAAVSRTVTGPAVRRTVAGVGV